jgi:hypothetical protein
MFHSAKTGHRSIQTRRFLRLESLENRHMLSLPTVAAVDVASTNWASSFVSYLESSGLGTNGYAIPVGSSAQLQTLPWTNINQILITFNENVTIAAADLSVSGVNKTAYTFSGFSYNSSTFTATWTLDAPIAKDKLILDLDANGMAPVKSASTGEVLDGAWTNCQSTFDSGNGQGGTDFKFCFNVLPGDVNGSNSTNTVDMATVGQQIGKNAGDNGYNIRCDIDGSGTITSADAYAVQARIISQLPTGNPVGMTNEAPTTSGLSDVSVATNATDYVLSLPNFFSDPQTPSSELTYSVVKDTNASLFNSLSINSSGNLDLSFAANTTGNATLTIRATDAVGLIVDTTLTVHVSAPPSITNFQCVNENNNYWTISGSVADSDDPVQGDVVTFGGVLASYNLSTTVGANGVFSFTVELLGLQEGTATAQTTDPHGVLSNVASVVVSDVAPSITNFQCVNENNNYWTISGSVADSDDPVQGDVVTLGGVLASYNLSTTVGANGVFSFTVELLGLQEGTATAQTADPHGVLSNLASVAVSDAAPQITDFHCINEISDFWTFTGSVVDNDDPVEGDVITFGGVLASYNLTTTTEADGVFSLTVEITGIQQGYATAQTSDPHGVLSNLAQDYIMIAC